MDSGIIRHRLEGNPISEWWRESNKKMRNEIRARFTRIEQIMKGQMNYQKKGIEIGKEAEKN